MATRRGGRISGSAKAAFRRGLFAWYAKHRRELPWRKARDPWRVLVSEVMLQQTQVGRVKEKYEAFFARWKDVHAFAGATLAQVLAFWSGLGYNRRAKNLHAAANAISRAHGGAVPATLEGLRALPGLGAYTAAAVMSFARNADVTVCDTNVRRVVLRRFFGGEFAKHVPSPKELDALLGTLVPKGRSRNWHSALMDFGSAVCTGRAPSCGICPFRSSCIAARSFAMDRKKPVRRLVRPQPRFEGSRRQARGAVIRALASAGSHGLQKNVLSAALFGVDLDAVMADLVAEGMVEELAAGYRLPE
jgi:A/G-specific adenine glycosylase